MGDLNLVVMKTSGGPALVPADVGTTEDLDKMKSGDLVRGNFKKARNPLFHRKAFALLNVGFEIWEPPPRGFDENQAERWGTPVKNFDRFREQVTVLAGFYDTVFNLDGTFSVVARSISFAGMDDVEFAKWYSAVADVLLQRVLNGYNRAELDKHVNQILRFV